MLTQNRTDLSGQQIGNYLMEELLVSRDVSDLYLGRDSKLDQPVFIEILHTTREQDPELAGSFTRRMESVSQIKHPNIASVIDIGINDDGHPYAIIEHIDGVWLDDQLDRWQDEELIPAVEESLMLVRQIADALSVAHPAGLIDHDLRPSNIILRDETTAPVLLDLGVPITVRSRDSVLTNKQSQTLDYASPEEIEGKAIGRRSNIYSLGIMLYELLTGHRPRLPTSSWDIFEHSTMPKEVPLEEERAGLSGETYRLVRNCLWRQEWSRFESADELITAIDTAILAEQSLPKAAIWSDRKRRWMYIAVPLIASLVLVIGLVVVWSQFATAQQGNGSGQSSVPAASVSSSSGSSGGGIFEDSNTPTATATATREAPPTSSAATTISVFSPSADQVFARDEELRFAWVWLTVVNDDEQFAVYVTSEDEPGETIFVGSATEPDNASLYVVESSPRELELSAGSYLWQVRLENSQTGQMIVESDPRRLLLEEEPTATPTKIPPTPTATATASPTATEIPPTATATVVVCEPAAPPGWLTHRVELGETPSFFSERANVPVEEILVANCLSRDAILSVGQQLFIPPPLATDTPTPRPTNTPAPTTTGGGDNSGGGGGGNNGGGGGSRATSTPSGPPPSD